MNSDEAYDISDMPTSRMCLECKGEGLIREETEHTYSCSKCKWCKGKGSIPISGFRVKADK